MDIKPNKLSPGWYVFSLIEKGKAIAGPFAFPKEAAKEMERLEKAPGTCFIAGIDTLNRKQRRARARKNKQKRK